jgi:glycerol-3-phosphate dehydrogenase subunit C
LKELERIFDICHGCRRCVSLCGAFPTLFDLVDEGKTGEVDGVEKKDLLEGRRPVLPVRPLLHDQVPLRAAARVEPRLPAHHAARQGHQVPKGEVGFGEKFLSSTDVHGQFAGIPIVVQVANAVNQTKPARA